MGGGFGVTYNDENTPHVREISDAIRERVRSCSAERGLPVPEIQVEPGRALVANAVVTLYRVGSVKRRARGGIVAVDGGMSDNIRPMLYRARYTTLFASHVRVADEERLTAVGKHCESGDVIAMDSLLPADVRPGDLIAVAATGAYGYSMASNYNRIGRPAVVGVRGSRAELWVRRETDDDMERLEVDAPKRAVSGGR